MLSALGALETPTQSTGRLGIYTDVGGFFWQNVDKGRRLKDLVLDRIRIH